MSEKIKIGKFGKDYNGTIVKVLGIVKRENLLEWAKVNNNDLVAEVEELLKEDNCLEYYSTAVEFDNTDVPVVKGVLGFYPVEYNYSQYWGLDTYTIIENLEVDTEIEFTDPSLKEEFNRFLEAANPYLEMVKKIAAHSEVKEHDFTENEIDAIETYAAEQNDAFEGDISESGWFYLREEEEVVIWVTGDTGFNFQNVSIDEII